MRGLFQQCRGLSPLAAISVLALVYATGCVSKPPTAAAVGGLTKHPSLGLSMVLPDGWQLNSPRDGFSLIRSTPYGGGYPTFNVRVVSVEDLPSLQFDGKRIAAGPGETEYRYERWSNARGRGYRLEALINAEGTWLFADASVWDAAGRMDQTFFNEVFWPLLNSVSHKEP